MAYTAVMKKSELETPHLIAQRLNQLIETKHLSKSDMARIAGVTRQSVNGWFKRGSISKEAAAKIAAAAGVPLTWLLGEDSDQFESLTSDERRLLELYRQFPSIEQNNMISAFEMRLKELKEFYNKYVLRNKDTPTQ